VKRGRKPKGSNPLAKLPSAFNPAYGCRAKTGEIANDGSCMRCQADQGVACREPKAAQG